MRKREKKKCSRVSSTNATWQSRQKKSINNKEEDFNEISAVQRQCRINASIAKMEKLFHATRILGIPKGLLKKKNGESPPPFLPSPFSPPTRIRKFVWRPKCYWPKLTCCSLVATILNRDTKSTMPFQGWPNFNFGFNRA